MFHLTDLTNITIQHLVGSSREPKSSMGDEANLYSSKTALTAPVQLAQRLRKLTIGKQTLVSRIRHQQSCEILLYICPKKLSLLAKYNIPPYNKDYLIICISNIHQIHIQIFKTYQISRYLNWT